MWVLKDSRRFLNFDFLWKQILQKLYQTISAKKFREFGYKAFHIILVTDQDSSNS